MRELVKAYQFESSLRGAHHDIQASLIAGHWKQRKHTKRGIAHHRLQGHNRYAYKPCSKIISPRNEAINIPKSIIYPMITHLPFADQQDNER